jgi:DNA-binding GntR family transcriptional regulator
METDAIPRVGKEHLTLSERVYRELRSAIIYQRIAPGTQLRSEELSDRLGVSRTPVKEALSRLRVEGLVNYSERHGFAVIKVTPQDLPDIYEAQMMIELAAIETGLPSASAEDLAQVLAAGRSHSQLVETDQLDFQMAYDADLGFHRAIAALGHNQSAIDWYAQLEAAVQGVRLAAMSPSTMREAVASHRAEHQPIFDGLERKNVAQAQAAVQSHTQKRLERTLQHITR